MSLKFWVLCSDLDDLGHLFWRSCWGIGFRIRLTKQWPVFYHLTFNQWNNWKKSSGRTCRYGKSEHLSWNAKLGHNRWPGGAIFDCKRKIHIISSSWLEVGYWNSWSLVPGEDNWNTVQGICYNWQLYKRHSSSREGLLRLLNLTKGYL